MRKRPFQAYPKCVYGPGGAGRVVNSPEEIPPGWVDNPYHVWPENKEPIPDGKDAWGGYRRDEIVQRLRLAGERIHSATGTRKLYERAAALGLFDGDGADDEDAL